MTTHRTFCRFCIAACGVILETDGDGHVLSVRGDREHPVSAGYCCSKGRAIGAIEHHPRRLKAARIGSTEADPAEVVADLGDRLGTLTADSIALYQGTGAGFDAALWAAGARFCRAIGTPNRFTSLTVDAVAKPHVSELMNGHPGIVRIPSSRATLVLIVGMNPVVSHGHTVALTDPVKRLRGWAEQGDLWVIDPRETETARLATRHIAPRPGTDHLLVGYLVRQVAGGALRAALEPLNAETVAEACGIDTLTVESLGEAVTTHDRIAALSGTGSTMAGGGNLTEWLLACLTALRPGGMWVHPGFFSPLDLTRRGAWRQRPSSALADDIETGRIRALVVLGGSPLTALPDAERMRDCLERLDVLAVADVVEGPLTSMATHVLPCPTQLERADITLPVELAQPAVVGQYTPAVRQRPGAVRSGWWWLAALAAHMGHPEMTETTDEDEVLRSLCDPARFDLARSAAGAVVLDQEEPPPTSVNLIPDPLISQLEAELHGDGARGLRLIPRRQRGHVNSTFMQSRDLPQLGLAPADAAERHITDGDAVTIASDHGRLNAVATVDATLRDGVVSVPHGYHEVLVNTLTSSANVDPSTGMPRYAGLPVEVERR